MAISPQSTNSTHSDAHRWHGTAIWKWRFAYHIESPPIHARQPALKLNYYAARARQTPLAASVVRSRESVTWEDEQGRGSGGVGSGGGHGARGPGGGGGSPWRAEGAASGRRGGGGRGGRWRARRYVGWGGDERHRVVRGRRKLQRIKQRPPLGTKSARSLALHSAVRVYCSHGDTLLGAPL
jgi:hypothetical protein